MLFDNQINALETSNKNNFESGVHFHATGTGKSWIGLQLILNYNDKYPDHNIIWICEQKFILNEQFNKKTITEKGFQEIYKRFLIFNYTNFKEKDWWKSISNTFFWRKPALIIINRAFLVSREKYKKIKLPIHLIIHDECHSIKNKTTQNYYNYILNNYPNTKCIGFSATPNLNFPPFTKLLTDYSIYKGVCDNLILPPKIIWFKSNQYLDYKKIINKSIPFIDELPYKKIIIWCGMIKLCNQIKELCLNIGYFKNFKFFIDTSKTKLNNNDFNEINENAILFCACKHREGSDIKNLDACIFLDKVSFRSSKTFVQCIGRVLRKDKDNKKKFGLVIDVNAHSTLELCNRINEYLEIDNSIFPWDYEYGGEKDISVHQLILNVNKKPNLEKCLFKDTSIQCLKNKFIRNVPDNKNYSDRINHELKMIFEKNLSVYLLQAVKILEITNHLVHVTRGSCGSSLICYLLGISHIDPVKYNIQFSRFLSRYRSTLPDIDFDFPHFLREEVFLKLHCTWTGKIARISNHVYYHKKSAMREALRFYGHNKFIGKNDVTNYIKNLSPQEKKLINEKSNQLENTFKNYSLHCGGIIFYPHGVPNELLLNSKKNSTIQQVISNKYDVANEKNFKIDILSSRALSQCYESNNLKPIDFENFIFDSKTCYMLQKGDNIGITLAESPLMRKALLCIKPKTIQQIAICLAIIRPAAKSTRYEYEKLNKVDYNKAVIFDDDAINLISKLLKCDFDEADKYRRAFSKNEKEIMNQLKEKIPNYIYKQLCDLRKYGFCKSHAYSYAQLVWKIAYEKANNPINFWKSTLKHNESFYRKWVHLVEAKYAGLSMEMINNKKQNISVYSKNRKKNFLNLTPYEQLKQYGYWDLNKYYFFPGCYFYYENDIYFFKGVIASLRVIHNKIPQYIFYIGVGPGSYKEIIVNKKYINTNKLNIISGSCKLKNELFNLYECKNLFLENI